MAQRTYDKIWDEAEDSLEKLVNEELCDEPLEHGKDRHASFHMVATFYVRYLQIMRNVEQCYNQLVQPQKRQLLRFLLDGVMGRLLELKQEMLQLQCTEYYYMDDILEDFKLMPQDLEVPIPRYIVNERKQILQDRQKHFRELLAKLKPKVNQTRDEQVSMSVEEAVRLVQLVERARQGRLSMNNVHKQKERKCWAKQSCSVVVMDRVAAAQKIQKTLENTSLLIDESLEAQHCAVQIGLERELVNEMDAIKDKIQKVEGLGIKEDIQEQIRQWFVECWDIAGAFPDYPNENDGGSAAIIAEKTFNELKEELVPQELDQQKKGKKNIDEKKNRKDKKEKAAAKKEDNGWKMLPSNFLPTITEGHKTYNEVWKHRDEFICFHQKFDVELMRKIKRKEVESEIRVQKKKAKKTRKAIDLTANRTIESLFEELVNQGVLVQPQRIQLANLTGEYSYRGTGMELLQTGTEPVPSLFDLHQQVKLCVILPLGSPTVHEKAPLVRSLLLVGPHGVGKKSLVHAICTETGANLFNLSAVNIKGKYPGKAGLQMLMHLVFKVARNMQPSVVWIDDAEKMFRKKVPKEEKELDPQRLKKELPKMLKFVKPGDRVLIVGTSPVPYEAELKSICKVYDKILQVPRPKYASRLALWRSFISNKGGVITPVLDLNSLSVLSDGYTPGHIVQSVQAALSKRRLQLQRRCPLVAAEFIHELVQMRQVSHEEDEKLKVKPCKNADGVMKSLASFRI
uniref:AAA+ ATPase domain-containing protein n=1 Tax=Eptatretus burgeri TaxID=7764 RepID=A0A8C4QAL5_EPTBU